MRAFKRPFPGRSYPGRSFPWLSICSPRAGVVIAAALLAGVAGTAHATAVSGQGTWETTLQGRDLDGNAATFEAYYDTALDITWLADANYSRTSNYSADGVFTWTAANVWATALNVSGITGWRLPTTIDADGPDTDSLGDDGCSYTNFYQGIDCGYNISVLSEMAHMYYVTLGNTASYTTSGAPSGCSDSYPYCLTNTGPFSNVQTAQYWSATGYALYDFQAWAFLFSVGSQSSSNKDFANEYAWAVHTGDVVASSPVPVPPAVWFFATGLLGLAGMSWKRRR